LGVPVKTRHNEVAPNQFEMAPIFESDSVAVDHNLILMETLHQVAHRHKLKVLFHEKPFKGVNGSGKHCNWSMSTDTGDNLLEPTVKPEANPRFLLFLVATLDAVYKHGALLRASIASASNEHRLGANEAPPGIVSAFLGEHLTEVLNAIEDSRDVKSFSQTHLKTVKLGGTVLDLKVNALPQIARDLTDRNRTSPFAFTGNKFEFRAVGSKSSPSFPTVLLNAAVAESITVVTEALLKQMGTKTEPSLDDVYTVVRQFIKSSKKIRFEGNGYSEEWKVEAEKRGLPNIKSCPVAFRQLIDPVHVKLLTSQGIMSDTEIQSRFHIMMEKYAKDIIIEAQTLKTMVLTGVLPAAYEFRKELIDSLVGQQTIGVEVKSSPEKRVLDQLLVLVQDLLNNNEKLVEAITKIHSFGDEIEQAEYANSTIVPLGELIRTNVDALEQVVPDKSWPFPKYTELLF
jgi:glutamine synthetase